MYNTERNSAVGEQLGEFLMAFRYPARGILKQFAKVRLRNSVRQDIICTGKTFTDL